MTSLNQKAWKLFRTVRLTAISCAGLTGLVWFFNLPYPMIRRPVAQTFPILLLPSYLEMDRNYREAIANVEGATQLIERATSSVDIDLGAQKVRAAQKNLDNLPVWFLGYEPQFYCSWFNCSWKFTFDEFQTARADVGRMEAKVFQEKNAMMQLQRAEAALQEAKKAYQQVSNPTEKQSAIATWQKSLDELTQLPDATLAGKMAQNKLEAYQRDFQPISDLVVGGERNNTMIKVAKQFASKAVSSCQNPPHSLIKWQKCQEMWQLAIARLETISAEDPGYFDAQTLLATYQTNLNNIEIRKQTEAEAIDNLESAIAKTEQLRSFLFINPASADRDYLISQLQAIIRQLEKVQPGTTAYSQSQELLDSAQQKLKQLK
ncbi:MAG: hypothetical protein MUD14_18745 [Hydrococcus sp. Prado102]|nr:hypothetical protein [Hydrococcus sp. Prado102]